MDGALLFLGSLAAALGAISWPRSCSHDESGLPPARPFLALPAPPPSTRGRSERRIRVLQFNLLADGLSGLLPDLGGFSRLSKEGLELSWAYRRDLILREVTRLDADLVCLQELDHFHDFLAGEMERRGYLGIFAVKPCSPCLAVSSRPDGCALFVREEHLRLVSSSTLVYSSGSTPDNQVAILAVLEPASRPRSDVAWRLVVATTHLKATKTAAGEACRERQVGQLLSALEGVGEDLLAEGTADVAFMLAGDLNARPDNTETVPALTYARIKSSSLGLRSVYNDDLGEVIGAAGISGGLKEEGVYTTWKARWDPDTGEEKVSKVPAVTFRGVL